jgi:hypothetical protein
MQAKRFALPLLMGIVCGLILANYFPDGYASVAPPVAAFCSGLTSFKPLSHDLIICAQPFPAQALARPLAPGSL